MSTPVRGPVADPIALQASLRARNESLRKTVLDDSMQGSGDRDAWMSRARSLATTTACYAAGVNLDVNAQRHDPGATQTSDQLSLQVEDARAHTELADLIQGSAGLQAWFKRAQQVGFAAGKHAARASELCDASTVGPIGDEIRRGLDKALAASSGSGNVQYWCDKTSDAVVRTTRDTRMVKLAGVARSHAGPGTVSAGPDFAGAQGRMRQVREQALSSLEQLAFGPVPAQTGQALQATMVAGAHAMELTARLSAEVATLRADLQAPDDAVLRELSAAADANVRVATQLGLQGSGTAQYWIECTSVMAARASAHAALVATHCNAGLLAAVRAPLERLMRQAPATADGEVHAMMKSAETAATVLIPAFQEVAVELRAAAAAQRAQAALPTDQPPTDEKKLEVEKTLQHSRALLWDETLQARSREFNDLQSRISASTASLQPLEQAQAAQTRRARIATRVSLASVAAVVGGGLLATAMPQVGLPLAGVGLAGLLGGGIAKVRATRAHAALQSQKAPYEKTISDLAASWVTARDLSTLARDRRDQAEQALKKIDSQLEIHHMAEAANTPVKNGETVKVDDDVVRIGNIVIRRNRVSDNNTVPSTR